MARYILVVDQGTTSTRVVLFDESFHTVDMTRRKLKVFYPKEGWVEQSAREIADSVEECIKEIMERNNLQPRDIVAMGITNQRETTIAWRKSTGDPLYNAIVWQCRRTAGRCNELREMKCDKMIKQRTGLDVDPYFSATKMEWLLENVEEIRKAWKDADLAIGTVDAFLMFKLTGQNITDLSNASRTMLFNIIELKWDEELLRMFGVAPELLPEVKPSAGFLGETRFGFPVTAIVGDQQGALFGQKCFEAGDIKCTYGTGAFILMNIGEEPRIFESVLTTVAWKIKDLPVIYALEGSIFNCGTVLDWLIEKMELVKDYDELTELFEKTGSTDLFFVPALTGLGAPHWDPKARGLFIGVNRSTDRCAFVRAAVEGIIFSVQELLDYMKEVLEVTPGTIRVDGGMAKNSIFMQFQADVSGLEVFRPHDVESTARGTAMLAWLGAEMGSMEELKALEISGEVFKPGEFDIKKYNLWKKAVERSKNWST